MELLKIVEAQTETTEDTGIFELSELQLAIVGGGAGDVVFH